MNLNLYEPPLFLCVATTLYGFALVGERPTFMHIGAVFVFAALVISATLVAKLAKVRINDDNRDVAVMAIGYLFLELILLATYICWLS